MKKFLCLLVAALLVLPQVVAAQGLPTLTIGIGEANSPEQVSSSIQLLFVFTILSLAPAILLMTTAFTRIVIVLSFLRQAMGTQQAPPNQVLMSLALFLTFYIMAPTWNQVNDNALQPYLKKQINQEQALEKAVEPLRNFMFAQASEGDLEFLVQISGQAKPANRDEIKTLTLIPAFMISELKRAFEMGFLIYIPFIVIDMVVASVLMAMGMMMLPPPIISLPFKLLLFVLVDGWGLVIGSLMQSFH